MARIFLIIAILLTVVSGVLSIRVKSSVKEKTEARIQAEKEAAANRVAAEKAATEAKAAKEQAATASAAKEAAEAAATTATAAAEKAKTEALAAAAALAAKEKELADVKAAPQTPAATPTPGPDPETLAKLAEAETKLKEQAAVTAALETKAKETEARAAALEQEKQRRESGLGKPGLEGKVLAVNPNWNFVVLSIGDHQGVVPNTTMLVKRGGALVAKVRITSVEPVTSIGDIVPGSAPTGVKGNYVQPGDVVIYGGS